MADPKMAGIAPAGVVLVAMAVGKVALVVKAAAAAGKEGPLWVAADLRVEDRGIAVDRAVAGHRLVAEMGAIKKADLPHPREEAVAAAEEGPDSARSRTVSRR
jgi:hypothetical protein